MIRQYLQLELQRRQKRNPGYSISAFARDLEIAPSTLHQYLKGQRSLSLKRLAPLLERAGADPTQRKALIQLSADEKTQEKNLRPLRATGHLGSELNATWLCYAVLSAFELRDFQSNAAWFAARLRVENGQIERILALLEDAGLITRSGSEWKLTGVQLSSGQSKDNSSLRQVHRECIEKSLEFLQDDTLAAHLNSAQPEKVEDVWADISGMTFSMGKRKLPDAVAMILQFRRNLAEYLCGGESALQNDEVYRLNIQLIPLTWPLLGKSQ